MLAGSNLYIKVASRTAGAALTFTSQPNLIAIINAYKDASAQLEGLADRHEQAYRLLRSTGLFCRSLQGKLPPKVVPPPGWVLKRPTSFKRPSSPGDRRERERGERERG